LIHQLPEKEINKLAVVLNSEIQLKKASQSVKELILMAPTWSDSDLNSYNEARISITQA
jgi:CDP-glycerol glycerophosphotransferase (TagB/SpsB family)